MKESGVAWIGEIPQGWEIKRMKDCFISNSRPQPNNTVLSLSYGKVIVKDMEEKKGVTPESYDSYQGVHPGDVVLRLTDLQNDQKSLRVGRATTKGIITSAYLCVSSRSLNDRYSAYLLHDVGDIQKLFYGLGGGVRQSMKFADLAELLFSLPPKSEQLAIADHLDRQTALIDQRLSTLADKKAVLGELRKATIHEAVTKGLNKTAAMKASGVAWIGEIPQGWELVRVKDVSPVNRGASPRPIDDPIYFDDDGEYAWVRIADVSASSNGFLETTTQRLSKLGEAKSVKRHPGDLFLSIAGTVGKACITKIKACIHDGFVYFPRMNEEATKKFFFYLFNSGLAYDGLGKFGTQLNLNTETVGSILVPLPPFPEQRAIADHLDRQTQQFDAQLATLDEQAQVLKELRKAIIHEAVTGKIDLSHYTSPQPKQVLAT